MNCHQTQQQVEAEDDGAWPSSVAAWPD